ncbi:hypothetical protein SAMN05443663_102653 [Flavobacterium defluvii]|uniref:Uncharacterized protein n=1 Tax=Flavobacterium defluvii TaxID=370979 RepID=A0A1M5JBI7_9FLAO|nr:hypothetical protein SAMN05443663_102653 [Flavobacterium defluvii]
MLKISSMMNVAETAITSISSATAIPTADVVQRPAAVVMPLGRFRWSLKIIPAPMNPSPVAMAASILATAETSSVRWPAMETNRQEAAQMQAKVLSPVFCCSLSLSRPIIPPRKAARTSLADIYSSTWISIR